MFHGGLIQLLAGMWEFSRNNVFAATAFSTYGALWMALSLFIILALGGLVSATAWGVGAEHGREG